VAGAAIVIAGALGAGAATQVGPGSEPVRQRAAQGRAIAPSGDAGTGGRHVARHAGRPALTPRSSSLRAAERYARGREGLVSFAVVDSRGRIHGLAQDRPYVSASVVKALLLAAELRRLEAAGAPLDGVTVSLLTRMITYSDNDAADAVYARVGDTGLHQVAARTGMGDFSVGGYWANAQITAHDIARFMSVLDRAIPAGKREFGLSVLERIVPAQQWGIPQAAGRKWALRFKGGWRSTELGQLVHQAAALRHPDGTRAAIAVLTDAQPTQAYGIETIRGIAERLLVRPAGESPGGR
jgi:Beta-lactamase enzyme family